MHTRMWVVGWLIGPAAAWAQTTVTFDIDVQAAEDLGLDPSTLESEMSALVADQLNLGDPRAFVEGMAQANAMASKGIGVDYATNIDAFVVGLSLGSAVADRAGFGRGDDLLPEGGFAFQASGMAGINLGLLVPGEEAGPLDRIRVYVSGMGFAPPGGRQFQGSMFNLAGHVQLKVIGPVDAKLVEWGGLDLTTGYEHTSYTLGLGSPELPFAQDIGPAEVTWTATGTYDVSASAQSIPIEVSTNLRLAVIGAYLGGAYDLNLSQQASSDATLTGPIDAEAQGQTEGLGSITVNNAATATTAEYVPRLFAGVQVNMSVIKVYSHLNVGFNDTFGGHLGVRIAK